MWYSNCVWSILLIIVCSQVFMLRQTVLQYCYCYYFYSLYYFIFLSTISFHCGLYRLSIFYYTCINGPWSLHEGDVLFGGGFSVLPSLFVVIETCTVAVPWLYWHSSSLRISSLNRIICHIGTIRYKRECSTCMYGRHMYCMYVSLVHVNVLHVQYALYMFHVACIACTCCMYASHALSVHIANNYINYFIYHHCFFMFLL